MLGSFYMETRVLLAFDGIKITFITQVFINNLSFFIKCL